MGALFVGVDSNGTRNLGESTGRQRVSSNGFHTIEHQHGTIAAARACECECCGGPRQGGIDTGALSQQRLEARAMPGLYFIGEVVDVTGWLGGYNFQWAWSSGHAAGRAL